jgi:hypothetical protein
MTMITCKWNRLTVCQERFNTQKMQEVLQDIDFAIQAPVKVLKDDPTSTVVVVKVNDETLVIKRANTKGCFHFLRRLVSASRAQRNWHFAHLLHSLHIPTFEPIAYLEERIGPLKKRSYFICSLINGIDALRFFSDGTYQRDWETVAKRIVEMIAQLAAKGLSHRDLNLSNILLVEGQPYLIDLDSMRQQRTALFANRALLHEVKRFMENWQDYPAISPIVAEIFTECFKEQGLV